METDKPQIDIPEELQQVCREFAEIAIKHGLLDFKGEFMPREGWLGDIKFSWHSGRHSEDHNKLEIWSNFHISTKVKFKNN